METSASSSQYDYAVFLCHNSKDKPIVRLIHQALRQEYDLPTYIDESNLVSGEEWEKSIHAAMIKSKTFAILIGGNGWGRYQLEGEAKPALARMAKDPTFRVIPVLLPGANPEALLDLREFFHRTHWVDFRKTDERAAIRTLASAIRGENPFPEGRPELTPMRVSFDSIRWDVSGRRDVSVLYEGQQLREARALLAERSHDFTDLATAFLDASDRRQNEELGRGLAAHAAALVNNPSQEELAANLALEAMRRFPTPQAHAVLSSIRTKLPKVTVRFEHPAPVTALAMNRVESHMAAGCQDGGVVLWDKGQLVMAQREHSAPVKAVVFDPDDAWLATGGKDGSIVIWGLEHRAPRLKLSLGDAVTKLEVRKRPEGNFLLASSGSLSRPGTVSLWSTAEWKQLWSRSMIRDATFDASGAHVVLAWGDHVVICDALSGELGGKFPFDSNVMTVAAHPKDSLIAATTFTRQIWLGHIDRETSEMRSINDRISRVMRVRFSADGRWLAAVGDDFHIRVWDVNTKQIYLYPYEGLLDIDVGFSPNGNFLSVISRESKSIVLWNLMSRQRQCVLEYDTPSSVLFSNYEPIVIAASKGTLAEVMELPSQDDAFWSIVPGFTFSLTFSPDGHRLAWIGRAINSDLSFGVPTLVVLRVDNGLEVLSVEFSNTDAVEAAEVVFEPEGKEIAVFLGNSVRVWNIENRTEVTVSEPPSWTTHPAREAVLPLPQSPRMVEACERRGRVSTVMSPNKKWLAIDHGRQLWSVWNVPFDTELFSSSMGGDVTVMTFSPESELFAAGDERGGISVWSMSGTPLAQFKHNEPISKLSFSSDATLLAAGSADSAVRMWLVAPEILAAHVRPRLRRNLSREEWLRYLGDEPYPTASVQQPSNSAGGDE